MSDRVCNFQKTVVLSELQSALLDGICDHCAVTSSELAKSGEVLEICGQEYCFDYETGVSTETEILLCPGCHEANHLDAQQQHNPCHISARRSREEVNYSPGS